jgi:hypothetical protein
MSKTQVVVSGGFDDIKSRDLRFLEEAAKLGELTVLLWPDAMLQKLTGQAAKISAGGTVLFFERRPLRQPRHQTWRSGRARFAAGNSRRARKAGRTWNPAPCPAREKFCRERKSHIAFYG